MKKIVSIALLMLLMLTFAVSASEHVAEAAEEETSEHVAAEEVAPAEHAAEEESMAEASTEEAHAEEPAKEEQAPGFECILAITGLLAVAFLVTGKKN